MGPASDRFGVVLLAVMVEGGLIVLAELLGLYLDRPPRALFKWNVMGLVWGFTATLPMLAMFVAMIRWPIGPLARIKHFTEEMLVPLLAPCTRMDLFGISLLAGLGEEMFFRGVLQGALQDKLSLWPGILIASALFGALHAITFTYALFATLMGIYLGWLWILSDNLLAPALAHALYDFLALLWLMRGTTPPELVAESEP